MADNEDTRKVSRTLREEGYEKVNHRPEKVQTNPCRAVM